MDLFKFALQIEKDSEDYYRELWGQSNVPVIKKILELLMNEEIKHYNIIMKISETRSPVLMPKTSILNDARDAFDTIKGDININPDEDFASLLEKAKELEEESKMFYRKESEDTDFGEYRDLLIQLSKEEEKHYFLLDNLQEFLRMPKEWVENGEFNHLHDEF